MRPKQPGVRAKTKQRPPENLNAPDDVTHSVHHAESKSQSHQSHSHLWEERDIFCKCETGQLCTSLTRREMEAPKRRALAHSQSKVITASSSILFSHWRRICQSWRETSKPHAMRALMGWFIGLEQWLPIWPVISHLISSCSTLFSVFWCDEERQTLRKGWTWSVSFVVWWMKHSVF